MCVCSPLQRAENEEEYDDDDNEEEEGKKEGDSINSKFSLIQSNLLAERVVRGTWGTIRQRSLSSPFCGRPS